MQRINKDIEAGTFARVYLLYGPEKYLVNQYKKKLLDALIEPGDTMNFNSFQGKNMTLSDITDICETMPFFADRRVLLIEDSILVKNRDEGFIKYLPELPETVCMILVEDDIDKRGKIYKTIDKLGRAIEFKTPDEKQLKRWVMGRLKKEGLNIKADDLDLFMAKTGTDMDNMQNELEKLISYVYGKNVISAADIMTICTTQLQDKVFDMIRAVSEKDQLRAMDLYRDLLALKVPPLKILALLERQYRQLLMARSMMDEGFAQPQIISALKIPAFAARNTIRSAASYSASALTRILTDMAEDEEAIKTGRLDPVISIELLIMKNAEA